MDLGKWEKWGTLGEVEGGDWEDWRKRKLRLDALKTKRQNNTTNNNKRQDTRVFKILRLKDHQRNSLVRTWQLWKVQTQAFRRLTNGTSPLGLYW